jgi:hypothetical protein
MPAARIARLKPHTPNDLIGGIALFGNILRRAHFEEMRHEFLDLGHHGFNFGKGRASVDPHHCEIIPSWLH